MSTLIDRMSEKNHFPSWWVEAIAIEYTNCRDFRVRKDGAFWKINLERIDENELENALKIQKVVISGNIIFHNVHKEVFGTRVIELLASNVPSPISTDNDSMIVEGLSSNYHFPFCLNGIDNLDPKQNLSQYFQVFENGELWQWKFADFISVEGRHYGKFVSDYVSLEKFDEQYTRYNDLLAEVSAKKYSRSIVSKIVDYFNWIDSIRTPLLVQLYQLHLVKKNSTNYKSKATEGVPPILSRFEGYMVALNKKGNNEIQIKFQADPVFYQSCCLHVKKATEIKLSIKTDRDIPLKLDSIYQEKASAIILGYMCVEAFINGLGYDLLPGIWDSLEKLALPEKIKVILSWKGKGVLDFNTSNEPFNTFINCLTSRHWLIHSKPKYESMKSFKMISMTPAEYYLRDELVLNIPERIKEMIECICKDIDINTPAWVNEAPGWSLK